MSEAELLPCPFCGPGESVVEPWHDDASHRWRVGCGRCGCSTGIHPHDKTVAPAIAAWNRRASLSPAATSGLEAGGWQDIKTAPKGRKVLVKFQSGEVEVCYQTDHGGGLMDSWRYAFARRGEQAPWPTEWCEIPGLECAHAALSQSTSAGRVGE